MEARFVVPSYSRQPSNRAVLVDTAARGMHTNDQETKRNPNTVVDSEPPMALDKFIEQTGLSPVTVWRFRKKEFLQTVNICGRHYVLRSEVARFNSRALAGEFSKPCTRPSTTSAGTLEGNDAKKHRGEVTSGS
jgi:hypothetical protein